jgi:hypothetical protein
MSSGAARTDIFTELESVITRRGKRGCFRVDESHLVASFHDTRAQEQLHAASTIVRVSPRET